MTLAIVSVLSSAGCGSSTTPKGSSGDAKRDWRAELRIVSLSPAISRTLVDFGLADRVIGRTPFCHSLDSAVPVVGDLRALDYERLVRLQPTHILVQPPAGGLDAALVRAASDHGWKIGSWMLNGIDDIEAMVRQLPGTLYPAGSEAGQQAAARAAQLSNDIASALAPQAGAAWRGSTLIVEQTDPVLAFGSETYLHDVLVALGGTNAVAASGWVQLSLEDVVRLNPQAIVIIREGPEATTRGEGTREAAGPLMSLDIAAARDGRIGLLRNPDALMPCSAILGTATQLGALLREFAKSPSPEAVP